MSKMANMFLISILILNYFLSESSTAVFVGD